MLRIVTHLAQFLSTHLTGLHIEKVHTSLGTSSHNAHITFLDKTVKKLYLSFEVKNHLSCA